MKRVVIHAGLHKTGSTSLQQLVRSNAPALRGKDIYTPEPGKIQWGDREVGLGSNGGGLHAIPKGLREGDTTALDAVLADFEKSGCTTAFLSSEGFDALNGRQIRALKSHLVDYRVEVILVLRHPLALARSLYCSRGRIGSPAPGTFLEQCKKRTCFNYRHLCQSYKDIGQLSIVPFEDAGDSAVAVLELALGSPGTADLLDESGEIPRVRESLPPEAAVAVSTMVRAFGSGDAVRRGLYPHWVEWVDEASERYLEDLPRRRTPYTHDDEAAFLEWWCGKGLAPKPDDKLGLDARIVECYRNRDEAVQINEETVYRLIEGFLGATFPLKELAGVKSPAGKPGAAAVTAPKKSERKNEAIVMKEAVAEDTQQNRGSDATSGYGSIVMENRLLNRKVAALEEELREYLRVQKGREQQKANPDKGAQQHAAPRRGAEVVYQSVRYRVGDILALAVTSPGLNTILVPVRLLRLFCEGLRRRRQRRQRQRSVAASKHA